MSYMLGWTLSGVCKGESVNATCETSITLYVNQNLDKKLEEEQKKNKKEKPCPKVNSQDKKQFNKLLLNIK